MEAPICVLKLMEAVTQRIIYVVLGVGSGCAPTMRYDDLPNEVNGEEQLDFHWGEFGR